MNLGVVGSREWVYALARPENDRFQPDKRI